MIAPYIYKFDAVELFYFLKSEKWLTCDAKCGILIKSVREVRTKVYRGMEQLGVHGEHDGAAQRPAHGEGNGLEVHDEEIQGCRSQLPPDDEDVFQHLALSYL